MTPIRVVALVGLAALLAAGAYSAHRLLSPEEPPPADANAALDAAANLPYATWVNARTEGEALAAGVTVYDRRRAARGLSLYNPRNLSQAFLIDMEGQVVHDWAVPREEGWHHIELLPGGDLLALVKDRHLRRLSWQSRTLWKAEGKFHHDVALRPDGGFWVPARESRVVATGNRLLPIVDDLLVHLDEGGHEVARISMWSLFGDRVAAPRWRQIGRRAEKDGLLAGLGEAGPVPDLPLAPDTPYDVFHLNSVEALPRAVPGLGDAGDLLISLRELDTIAVIDPSGRQVKWSWGPGEIEAQHQPTLLADDRVLVFDNGKRREWSRVVEVDPRQGAVVWEYSDPETFFTASRGGAERLPNGNTLVTESNSGRVFEVTADGRVVWEFFTPETRLVGDPPQPQRAAIYRMGRITDPREWRIAGHLREARREQRAEDVTNARGGA